MFLTLVLKVIRLKITELLMFDINVKKIMDEKKEKD